MDIPHHLIDIIDPDELFTAGEFARVARDTIAEISARGRLPILAGGTGFYLRALLDGLFEGPARDQPLRDRLATREARRAGSLHRILKRLDSVSAAKIHANDIPKVTRALEVCLLTRRPVSELFEQGRDALRGYRTLKLGLLPDRDVLYPASGRALRVDVRERAGGRGAANSRAGIRAGVQAFRIARLQAGAATHSRRTDPARRSLLRAAQYAQLCEAADHVVPQGAAGWCG